MSFKPTNNPDAQLSCFSLENLVTDDYKEYLENNWPQTFRDKVYFLIDEEPFKVLYSENSNSRPGKSVRTIVGSLILKEMFGLSDEELVQRLASDYRFRYALHLTDEIGFVVNPRTLTRFRTKVYNYELETGVDLVHEVMEKVTKELNELMDMDTSFLRMDSMMVQANIKNLSRYELFYEVNKKAVKLLKKNDCPVGKRLKHYLNDGDRNYSTYHNKSPREEKVNKIVNESRRIKQNFPKRLRDSEEYKNLERLLQEQTKYEEGDIKLKEKDELESPSTMMQSPVDPEATFRTKAGKGNLGYSANFLQASSGGSNLIEDYQVEQNVHSDEEFFKENIETVESLNEDKDTSIVTDGAYGGTDNLLLAEEKGINFFPTDLPGAKTDPGYKDFIIDEFENTILCPNDQEPKKISYNEDSEQYYVSFDKKTCESCPCRSQCPLKEKKTVVSGTVSKTKILRAEVQECLESEEVRELAHFRNGVEAVPSQMRSTYNIDKIPHHGKIRTRQDIGFKVIAYNVKSFFRFEKKSLETA